VTVTLDDALVEDLVAMRARDAVRRRAGAADDVAVVTSRGEARGADVTGILALGFTRDGGRRLLVRDQSTPGARPAWRAGRSGC
jgi:hypothetical protein